MSKTVTIEVEVKTKGSKRSEHKDLSFNCSVEGGIEHNGSWTWNNLDENQLLVVGALFKNAIEKVVGKEIQIKKSNEKDLNNLKFRIENISLEKHDQILDVCFEVCRKLRGV